MSKKALRGVNLGGWLVLERWLSPRLFGTTDAVDEYTYCEQQRDNFAALKSHRDTFVTETDFAWLTDHGIEAVRLPVGYWMFGDVKPYAPTVEYVDKAFIWAKKHDLKVLIDLHGAPMSQNGKKHSGRSGATDWKPDETLDIITRIADRYGNHPALLGISLLNEPSPELSFKELEVFYARAYQAVRERCSDKTWVVFSDAFRPYHWWRKFRATDYPGMTVDYHHYQIYGWLNQHLSIGMQLFRTKYLFPGKLRRMGRHHPLIVGEWCGAVSSKTKLTVEERQAYIKLQEKAFSNAAACFYWTYKTPYGSAWSYRHCVEQGWIV
ncbi:MAG TPA: cellulase family glycosylhydrolase [Candidatus Saccharimonadales bacterium]